MGFLLIILVCILTCASQILQKMTATLTPSSARLQLLLASLLLLGIALLLWLAVLTQIPVSVAYPLLSLNYLLMALISHQLWGEKMTVQQWQGLALIMVGITCIGVNA